MRPRRCHYRWIALGCAMLVARWAVAQDGETPAAPPGAVNEAVSTAGVPAAATGSQGGTITLNFPENVPLKALIDYVGQRRGINFIYDATVASRQVTIKAPQPIPADALLTLLESLLKVNSYALVPTEVPGTMRVVPATALAAVAVGPEAGASSQAGPAWPVTRVIELHDASPKRVEEVITPFLTAGAANVVSLPEHNRIIVSDYAGNLPRIERMIALVDRPAREVAVRFMPVENMEATAAAQQVTQMLTGKAKAQGGAADATSVTVLPVERTNQVVVIGRPAEVEDVLTLVGRLDMPLEMTTQTYTLTGANCDQADTLTRKLIGEFAAKHWYTAVTDRASNLLIVSAPPRIQEQVAGLCRMLDQPRPQEQSPVRFYKLENAKAKDVLATLENIEGDAGLRGVSVDGVSGGVNGAMDQAGGAGGGDNTTALTPGNADGAGGGTSGAGAAAGRGGGNHGARVMADEATNTIIVVTRPTMQPIYEKLIQRLDVRRAQVLVEATVVTVDTTDSFNLSVSISSNASGVNGGNLLNFSQFGLTTADADTGKLTLKPGLGFNGALLSADIAEIVLQALKTDARVKVMSQPSVLVNDNAKGVLTSENEEPYGSINTTTTGVTSITQGGTSKAGTTITVEPQISEGDHLRLKYEIELSSFGTRLSDSLPPPKQSNTLTSDATIPDGYTIVVGGLTRDTLDNTVHRVPVLGDIPYLEYLLSDRSNTKRRVTLFVFLRAVVLRDDKFADLKALSGSALGRAELPRDLPESEPAAIY